MHTRRKKTESSEGFFRYFFCWPVAGNSRGVPLLFRRNLGDIAPVLVVVIAALIGLPNFQVLHLMELWVIDMQFALKGPHEAKNIYIVKITDEDYATIFNATSPLPADAIKDLLADAAKLDPKIIGVDLDTADASWKSLCEQKTLPTCVNPVQGGTSPIVVWAAAPETPKSEEAFTWENKLLTVTSPLGGALRSEGSDWTQFAGVPGFPLDADGKVRQYKNHFNVRVRTCTDSVLDTPVPLNSFERAVAEKFESGLREADQPYLEFGRVDFPTITAGELMQCAKARPSSCAFKVRGKAERSPQGKIMLIGGQFHAARDAYETPHGPITGVELNGTAIDSAVEKYPVYDEPRQICKLLLDLAVGIILTLSYWWFERKEIRLWGLVVGTLVIPAGALIASYCLFHFFAFAVPVLVGINLHQYIEHLRMAAHR